MNNDFSKLPPPPKGQTGMTLNQLKNLPKPPVGQKGMTLDEVRGLTTPKTLEDKLRSDNSYQSQIGSEQVAGVNKIKGSLSQAKKDITEGRKLKDEGNTIEGFGKVFRGVTGAVAGTIMGATQSLTAPLTPLVQGITKNFTLTDEEKKKLSDVENQVRTENPNLAKVYDSTIPKLNQIIEQHPETATVVKDVIGSLVTILGGKTLLSGLSKRGLLSSEALGTAKNQLVKDVTDITALVKEQAKKISDKKVIKAVSPKLTPKESAKAISQGRATEGGILSKSKIKPDSRTLEVANSVKGIVKGKNLIEDVNSVKNSLSKEAETLKTQIKSVDHPYTYKELASRMNKVETPISIKGTAFEKQISAVKNAALRIAKEKGGNISSLLDARKEFDALVDKEYPNLYDRENAPMRNAITAIRNTMNDFIEENLPKGTSFKDSLKKQNLFYEAIDNMSEKAASDIGKSKITKGIEFIKENPVTSAIAGYGTYKAQEALRNSF